MNLAMILMVVCGGGLVMLLLVGGAIFFFTRRARQSDSSPAVRTPAKTSAGSKPDDSWLHEGNFSSDVVRGEPATPREEPIKPGSNIVGTCPNCGGEIEAGWTACQYCGTAL